MDNEVKTRILASMHAGRLVMVCGAGLSMAPPSCLPSAKAVAETCFDAYVISTDPGCDPSLRGNLEDLAEHFAQLGSLETIFIDSLVPWEFFVQLPNPGHAAIADFLITRAVVSALSANYDRLIERCAEEYGADFLSSLDGDEANSRAVIHSPLLKFHGCATRHRSATVWAKSQLENATIESRIAKSRTWMNANLREKDFLVVGFWSDWAYLNTTLVEALAEVRPLSITLVDMAPAELLEDKAPDLWALAHAPHVNFTHVEESGADVLDELRRAFSRGFLRQVLHAGREAFEEDAQVACEPQWLDIADLESEALYNLRRDSEGVPSGKPARSKNPSVNEVLGLFHLLLRSAGASETAEGYEFRDQKIRVINGEGAILSRLPAHFQEPPSVPVADVVVAVGSTDLGVPGNVVRTGRPADIMRPAPANQWVDFKGARELFGV